MPSRSRPHVAVSLLRFAAATQEQPGSLEYRIQVDKQPPYDCYIKSPSLTQFPGFEAALPLAILPAMRLNLPIHVAGEISRSFTDGVARVIRYYADHFEGFSPVEITADRYFDATPQPTGKNASFFSGGVDSFYTLLKGRDALTDIITIRGFDISLGDEGRWQKTRTAVAEVAHALGLGLHEVESNFGKIIKEFGSWIHHGHGLALASVARAMAGHFDQIRIPGTYPVAEQIPWGSSAMSDPEFSDERITILHDADASSRADKTVFIAQYPIALKYLRVCPGVKNDGHFNCCRCEKCLRTMTALHAINVLHKAEAFPLPLTPGLVAEALVLTEEIKRFADENIQLMEQYRPDDRAMLQALHKQRNRPLWLARLLMKLRRKRRHLERNLQKLRPVRHMRAGNK